MNRLQWQAREEGERPEKEGDQRGNLGGDAGQSVSRGDTLVVLEAMKMELTVSSPRDGTIEQIAVAEGDQVVEGARLVTFAEE